MPTFRAHFTRSDMDGKQTMDVTAKDTAGVYRAVFKKHRVRNVSVKINKIKVVRGT